MNKLHDIEDILYAADQERRDVREEYREEMEQPPGLTEGIYFPQIHIDQNDKMMREGLPWLYNGYLVVDDGLCMAVDPGVDFFYRLQKDNISPSNINAIYVSHDHLDHYADAEVLIDWLIRAKRQVQIIMPQSVADSGAISNYHAGLLPQNKNWPSFRTPLIVHANEGVELDSGHKFNTVELRHGAECLGFVLETRSGQHIGYISDTGYAKEVEYDQGTYNIDNKEVPDGKFNRYIEKYEAIKKAFSTTDIIIANVDSFAHTKNSRTHLSVLDLVDIVKGSNAKEVIISHVNPMGELDYAKWGGLLKEYVRLSAEVDAFIPDKNGMHVPFE